MKKFDMQQTNPERYKKIKAEQEALSKECSSLMEVARICPYCKHRCSTLLKGEHSYSREKCPNCGEEIVFPPLKFRMAN